MNNAINTVPSVWGVAFRCNVALWTGLWIGLWGVAGLAPVVTAEPIADVALLKFYGGIAEIDSHSGGFNDNRATANGLGLNAGTIGVDQATLSYDTGTVYGVAIEYFFADHWGIELSWERHESEISRANLRTAIGNNTRVQAVDGGELDNTIYALSIYYDFGPVGASNIQPYLGVGYLQVDETTVGVAGNIFTQDGQDGIQYIVGFAGRLSSNWYFFFDYRNISLEDTDLRHRTLGSIRDVGYDAELIFAGLSLEF